ncbi:MAG: amino acid ABC transporter permease [Ruminococcaceae bacterium]|nr:amino acid ABC transporter permease [Oscillospiraceae bacterium]
MTFESFCNVTLSLLEAFKENIVIFAVTLLAALPLGLVMTFGSMSNFKPLRWLVRTFVWVIRGTPLMLQLFIFMYCPGLLFGYTYPDTLLGIPIDPRMNAALIAFIINYAAYFSEIYRGGIESISKGQYEAGQVLGMTKSQIFFKVVLMQVVKRIVPPMGNEIITLIKDTSLARVIAVSEIMMTSYEYAAEGIIWPLFYTGVFFLLFCGLLTILLNYVEKKLDYYH